MQPAPKIPRPRTMPAPMPAGTIRALGMDSAAWHRHASPWSVYTRMATLPFLAAAIWSHSLLGPWAALGLTLLVVIWLRINPRLFPAPKNTENWASKATFGERIWLNRRQVPIPRDVDQAALVLSAVTAIGFIATLIGALRNDWMVLLPGLAVTYAGKLVLLNRLVQLYERMRNAHPLYRFWSIAPQNDNDRQPTPPVN